ncbi:MAG: polysaccharide biosynthesis protein [Lachnospiraceae bacterium]|nr:polysaccharide biosynthesis protein [Lachnospiraceae bacterium]MDD3617038.1 polysaccharide biosynthesis protein [Lachnospiraceae bacterium]
MGKNEKSSVLKQASVLAVAGLIVRMIGLLYRSPMKSIIGSEGAGYYGYAYNVYTIMLLISSYSIPMAVSKVMAERIALKEYKNAQKVFKGALIYVTVVGGAAALIILTFAKYLLPKGQENAILALQVLAPTVLLSGYLGVLRGYFQAHRTMVPTSISQILEQIFNAIVSVGACWFFTRSVVDSTTQVAIRGAAGGTLGTGAGVLFGLIFMIFVYFLNSRSIKGHMNKDHTRQEESYKQVFRVLIMMVTPIIFSTCVYNLSAYVDQTIFSNVLLTKGMEAKEIASQYGIFSLQYMTMINIPIALASATSSTIVPAIAGNYAKGDKTGAKEKIDEGVQFTMFLAIPATIGMGVLGVPLMRVLFPGNDVVVAGHYLTIGCISIVFYCLSTITNGVLQSISKAMLPVRNAGISLAINMILLFGMLELYPQMGVLAVILATILYSMCICLLNSLSIRKHLQYKNQIKKAYLVPLAASAAMGVVVWGLNKGISILMPDSYFGNLVSVGISVLVGIIVYILLYLVFSKASPEELKKFPFGTKLLRLARMLHLR